MKEQALSESAMRASLQDIRLPSEAAGGLVADLAVAVGMGGLLALVALALIGLFSRRRVAQPSLTLAERLAEARSLPEAERRVACLHLLREAAPETFAELAPMLYRPDGQADPEAEVSRLV